MKALFLVALISAVAFAEKDYDAMFRHFKATHLKSYANEAEEAQRFKNFVANMRKAQVMQSANPLATFGVNKFADMSAEEFQQFLGGAEYYKQALASKVVTKIDTVEETLRNADASVDWRTLGKVSDVKNQGSCGSCWAFSATGNIESVWAIYKNTPIVTVSEQELTSCDTIDSGCSGGLMDNAFKWLINTRQGEIVTEAAYPYTSGSGSTGTCKTSELNTMAVGAKITGYNHLANSEAALQTNLVAQPIAVAVDATSFQSYTGGILTTCTNRHFFVPKD